MVAFEKITFKYQQKLHFQSKVNNIFLGYIPSFYKKVAKKKELRKTNIIYQNKISSSAPFRTLITKHQCRLQLRHTTKNTICNTFKKENNFMLDI